MLYRLRPSDLTFLYEGCQRCFYLSVVRNISQPSIPIPAIFNRIANLLKKHYAGKRTNDLFLELPPGTLEYGENWVRSIPIQVPGIPSSCYIRGRLDIVAAFDDDSYGVIDFKTGSPNDENWRLYGRQLHAYTYALEHAAKGELSLSPITKLGLVYFYPTSMVQLNQDTIAYEAQPFWVPLEKNENGFLAFISDTLKLLSLPEPPAPNSNCQWCSYVENVANL